jgi:signal transduction histidine kinase
MAHLPPLLLAVLLRGDPLPGIASLLGAVALLGVAVAPLSHRARSLAATGSLLICSGVLGSVVPDHPEVRAHIFVVVALLALYQDWTVLMLAIVGALGADLAIHYLTAVQDPLRWALLRSAFVVLETGLLMVFWLADERAHAGEERLQIALWEGQSSLQRRLEETERIRTDLIGTVSHEFRTPLTGIRGAALTLLKRGDRLDHDGRRQLLEGILDHQARLSRLLENVLTASRATAADHSAVAEVDEVAAEVAMIAGALRPDSPRISTYVEQGTLARMDRHALHQVLANLLDNAQQHGRPGGQPVVAGGHDSEGIWITVTNEGQDLDPTAARHLFEPFTQADSGPTRSREGLGMGLYVVRRLVEVYGGTVAVRAESGWITVEVRLQPAEERRHVLRLDQEPTAEPIPKVSSAAAPPSKS